jgi:hypothetical protein
LENIEAQYEISLLFVKELTIIKIFAKSSIPAMTDKILAELDK